jgi:transcriptional regulator with XRE-family HTH domain
VPKRPSDVAAERIRALRKRHGWTQQQLADRLRGLGSPIDRVAITKIEAGQRGLPLDEAFLFAFALDVAPINLFLPLEDEDVQIAARTVASSALLRGWVVGEQPLGGPDGGQDPRLYFSEVPMWTFQVEQVENEQFKRELADAAGEGTRPAKPKEPS